MASEADIRSRCPVIVLAHLRWPDARRKYIYLCLATCNSELASHCFTVKVQGGAYLLIFRCNSGVDSTLLVVNIYSNNMLDDVSCSMMFHARQKTYDILNKLHRNCAIKFLP